MERGPNDHIAPGAQLDGHEENDPPVASGPPLSEVLETLKAKARAINLDAIAKTCYAVNSVYCRLIGDTPREWDECRESVLSGVEKALAGATPEQLHDAWCDFQRANGWVYGETKDAVAKTHPCLVPYDQLPAEQRNKDQFFLAVVGSLQPFLS
jgi:hypothetical protein